jgi:4-hydroxy-3-polyprenylbenzoate decarboxylase
MTALCDRVPCVRAARPCCSSNQPGHSMPVLGNLFGTTARVARAMGVADVRELRPFGELLANLKEPEAPKGFKDMVGLRGLLKTLWHMTPKS